MNSHKTLIVLLLLLVAPTAYAGGICRHNVAFQNVANLAIVQPDYYYAVQAQSHAPFVYQGDVDSILQTRQQLLRLSNGLITADIQAQKQLLTTLPLIQPIQAQPQRIEGATGCKTPCDCGKCPTACKPCNKIVPDPVAPTDPVPGVKPASDLDAKAIDVLTRYNCIKCHGKPSPDGGFPIATGEGVIDLGRGDRFEIHGKAATNEMPPAGKGQPLTPEDLDTLYRWANSKGR